MVDNAAMRIAVRDYVRDLARSYDLGHVLYGLTDHSVQVLGCDGAGVSVGDPDGHLRFVTATEQRVVHIEEEQAIVQEGPCFAAFETGRVFATADLELETRWERYRGTALAAGYRAVLGVPMVAGDTRIGAMNLYSEQAHEWTDEELEVAQLFGDMATGYILNHRTLSASRRLADQLQEALDSRVVVEQAKGVVAARQEISLAEAFHRLRSHARQGQLRLHEVARRVVEDDLDV